MSWASTANAFVARDIVGRAMASLLAAETAGATDQDLEKLSIGVFTDVTRSGAPPRFSAEQVAGIMALACEPPGGQWAADVALDAERVGARSGQKRRRREHFATPGRPFFLAIRPCDCTRASTGSPRTTSERHPLNTKPMSNDCATPTGTRRDSRPEARTS